MEKLNCVRPEIKALNAYHVQDSTGFLKLDAMENPYGLPESLHKQFGDVLSSVAINRYPEPIATELIADLHHQFNIPDKADVILGNGSDELLTIVSQTVASPKAVVLGIEPSFVMYRMNALFSQMRYIGVSLKPDFTLDLPTILETIKTEKPALVFIAYPNNPTGNLYSRKDIEAIIEAAEGVGIVVLDEAYQSFSSDSFINVAGEWEHVIVMRTLSKIGLAGIRLGYAAGAPALIRELNKVRPPYNVNRLTQAAAKFCLEHKPVLDEQARIILQERERLFEVLKVFPEIIAYPSEANFITIRVPDAQALFDAFLNAKILIKKLHGTHPLLENCLRLTVGMPEENLAVLDVLMYFFQRN